MTKFLEKTRYLVIIAVFGLLVAALAAFGLGLLKTWEVAVLIFGGLGKDAAVTVKLLEVVDGFLVATTLLIFSLSLYELFIAELHVPDWMVAHNLHDLKARLSSMIVLVMAVKFVEKLAEAKDAQSLLLTAIAVTVVSAALIAFSYLGAKD
jgi:uncharacterized membrane protein YqhA